MELASWQDGGCKIQFFTVEFRRNGQTNDWIVVSSNVAPQTSFPIPDLEAATAYSLRITASNNAGATVAEYAFQTLSISGSLSMGGTGEDEDQDTVRAIFLDSGILFLTTVTLMFICVLMTGLCCCIRYCKCWSISINVVSIAEFFVTHRSTIIFRRS